MLRIRNVITLQQKRWKGGKQRWSVLQNRKKSIDRALENFDDFYGSVFGLRWKHIRASLLTEHKYIALVNNFGDTEQTCSMLEMNGAINVKSLIKLAQQRLQQEDRPISNQNATTYKLDARLKEIMKRTEEREIRLIYPDNEENSIDLPERLQYHTDAEKLNNEIETSMQIADVKKSLEQAMREDKQIDLTRLVDPALGTGGLYEYIPANKIKGMEDWIPESEHYRYYQTTTDFPFKVEMQTEFLFPENLCLYTYEMGNCSEFKPPKKCLTGVLSHYLMDGASILPSLFLDVKHGERVLDACAAPGGKSLLMLQTLHPEVLICNDVMESRVNRLRKVMQEYFFDFKERWDGKYLILNQCDARNLNEYDSYDKVLVDVPCTTDRHSLMQQDNNIFKPSRIKERLRIPELQAGILANCLRLVKPGGSLVYSTCSLSPVQNDGVVHMALQKAFNDHRITTTIKDLSMLIKLFSDIYKFEDSKSLKYGQMVLPYLPANFGPLYFSKIKRNT